MKAMRLFAGVGAITIAFVAITWPAPFGLGTLVRLAGSAASPAVVAPPALQAPATAARVPPPAAGVAIPVAIPVAGPARLAPLEAQMLVQLNAVRADNDLPLLALDAVLADIARERSADMVARDYFAHTTPDGGDVYALLDARQVQARFAGENLARNNWGEDQTVLRAVQGFMGSTPHRENVLNVYFTRVGVGVAVSAQGMKVFAVVFVGN
jgi:uncharacterized protein YkwD